MPTYPMFQAVPAGQTGPLGGEQPLLTRIRGVVCGGFSPLARI